MSDEADFDAIAEKTYRLGRYDAAPGATPEQIKAEIAKALRAIAAGDFDAVDGTDDD